MEVRCERCKTEYEFDDTGVPEAGVAVQCTTCGHVFKVKKKAVLVTMPLQPGEVATVGKIPPEPARAAPPTPAGQREWKVRQPSGNHFTLRELTTLQKWIVERKVGPDDEISLAGTEHWKRLGNIPALAPFFSVVEEAHGRPHNGPANARDDQLRSAAAGPTQVLSTPPTSPPAAVGSAPGAPASLGSSIFAINPTVASVQGHDAAPTVIVDALGDNYVAEDLKTGRGAWFLLLLTILLLGGGGYFGYMHYWQPQQQKEEAAARASARAAQAQLERDRAAALEQSKALEEARAKLAQEAKSANPASPAQAAPSQDVPETAVPPPASETTVAKKGAPTPQRGPRADPPRNFDYYMAQGYRSLEKTPSLALQAYAKAAELRPDRAEPIGGRGLALLKMGDLTQAEASFQEALKLNPNFGIAVIGLAKTYLAQGRKDKAAEYYGKYLEILPDGPEANGAKLALKRLRQE